MPPEEEIERIQSVDRRPTCFLAIPESPEFDKVREACLRAAEKTSFRTEAAYIHALFEKENTLISRTMNPKLYIEKGCVIADITLMNAMEINQIYTLPSHNLRVIVICNTNKTDIPSDSLRWNCVRYDDSVEGINEIEDRLISFLFTNSPYILADYRKSRVKIVSNLQVNWDSLGRTEAENLCFELLSMMGFQRVEWVKENRPFDIVAELLRHDPDGFIYRDMWIISTCRNPELLKEIENIEEILYEMLDFDRFRNAQISPPEDQFTILYIQTSRDSKDAIEHIRELIEEESRLLLPAQNKIRIRIWDQTELTSLVSRHPNLCNKYFSEDYRSRSSHRKSFEEINLENVNLMNQLVKKNAELTKEKRLRVSAERDAVWKDLAFVAAHKLGNPVFAIETFIDPIEKRISENNQADAIAILSDFRSSIDKAKDILDQFKHLTTAQNINLEPTQLRPLLDDSCRVAQAQGVEITVKCGDNIIIQADPKRLAECFDELIKNSLSWMQDSPKKISIDVIESSDSRSDDTASSIKNLVILFSDNGPGVSKSEKDKIFQAFHSNRPGGSGLGLAFVRRIIEGHDGSIQEIGLADQGCVMRITLPMFDEPSGSMMERFEEPKRKPKSKRKKK